MRFLLGSFLFFTLEIILYPRPSFSHCLHPQTMLVMWRLSPTYVKRTWLCKSIVYTLLYACDHDLEPGPCGLTVVLKIDTCHTVASRWWRQQTRGITSTHRQRRIKKNRDKEVYWLTAWFLTVNAHSTAKVTWGRTRTDQVARSVTDCRSRHLGLMTIVKRLKLHAAGWEK